MSELSQLAIQYLLHGKNGLKVPSSFHSRVRACKKMLECDYSSLVTTNFDFGVNVANVPLKIETNNKNLTNVLDGWKKNINSSLRGKIPTGIRELFKEYLKERWTSSLIVMNAKFEKDDKNKLILPSKVWFMDSGGINIEGEGNTLGDFEYLVNKNKLPISANSEILVQKPFDRFYTKYPSPYFVRRGTLVSWIMKKALKEHSTEILDEIVPYILLKKHGSEAALIAGKIDVGEKEYKTYSAAFKKYLATKRMPKELRSLTTGWDVQLEEFIPDLIKIFKRELYEEIDRDILSSLGMIEIIEGVGTTRQQAILNPKPFIREIYAAINDFASLMEDLIAMIVEKNKGEHRKYFSENMIIRVKPGTPHIGLEGLLVHFRSLYDRGLLSKKTYLDIVEQDFDTEIERRKFEAEEGIDERLYPQVTQNLEQNPYVPDFSEPTKKKEKTTDDKKGPEKKNFKNARQEVKCRECGKQFTLDANVDLETTGCPYCTSEYIDLVTAPYTLQTLPKAIKNLPKHAQEIWMEAFNASYKKWGETRAFKIAWSAVKLKYKKVGDKWVKRAEKADIEQASVDDLLKLEIKAKQLELLTKLTKNKESK